MGLKDIARQLNGENNEGGGATSDAAEDSFDAPMMIMNQINEA